MANKITQTFDFRFDTDITNLKKGITKIEQEMQKIKMPQSATTGMTKDLGRLKDLISSLESKSKGGIINLDDAGSIQKIGGKIREVFTSLTNKVKDLGNLSDKELEGLFPADTIKKIEDAKSAMDKYEKEIKETNAEIKKQQTALEKLNKAKETKGAELEAKNQKTKMSDAEYEDLKKEKTRQKGIINRRNNQAADMQGKYDDIMSKYGNKSKTALDGRKNISDEDRAFVEKYNKIIQEAKAAETEVDRLNKKINSSIKTSELDKVQNEYNQTEKEITDVKNKIDELNNTNSSSFVNLINALKQLKIPVEGVTSIDQLTAKIQGIKTDNIEKLKQGFNGVGNKVDELESKVSDTGEKISGEFAQAANGAMSMKNQFNQLSTNIQYFFGMANGIQLFKRTLREALQSIKELDASMVKIATVSEYDMSDMWSTLPEFTKRANELGVAITEVYDATGLYVQQGLDLVESQGLANETLKMAKIAGMDAAAATDAMTSALRGFNLELNQGSAERVNDIYSKLAAITASDTQEIATAMSKTASIANNAGASIENTSAFLSMIIETTRESAETAGTALKTVIARFSELKKNPAEIGDVDGEIVDANQIESALRLAEVDLRDATGQFRNFDEVIIELSGKWDGLDKNTQRYIATMAAGSRQQSRFLALMSDSDRLAQLTDAAYNSAGASTTQFNKTLDSMESKLSQLKNAWNTFTQNLMNNELLKFFVDLLTGILTAVNGISEAFSGLGALVGSILSATMVTAFFALAQKGVNALLSGVASGLGQFGAKIQDKMQEMTSQSTTSGANAGKQYATSFINSADPLYNTWYAKQKRELQRLGNAKPIGSTGSVMANNVPKGKMSNRLEFKKKYGNDYTQYSQLKSKDRLYTKTEEGGYAVSDLKGNAIKGEKQIISKEEMNKVVSTTKIKPAIKDYEKLGRTVSGVGTAMMGLGVASSLIGQQLREAGNDEAAEAFEKIGAALTSLGSIMMIFGPLLPKLAAAFKKFNADTMKSMGKWMIIIAIIAMVITVVKTLVDTFNRNSLEGKLKNIKKQTEKAAEAAQKAQEAYSEWLSNRNEYNGLLEALEDLTEGTEAWSEQMDKIQDKIYEMINTYPELAQYIQADGTISEEGMNVLDEKLKKEKQRTISVKVGLQMAQDELQYQKDLETLTEEEKDAQKEINKIEDEEQRAKKQKEHDAYYKTKREELDSNFSKTYEGNLNFLAQNAGVDPNIVDDFSAVKARQNPHEHGQNIQNKIQNYSGGYHTATDARNLGFAAAGTSTAVVAGSAMIAGTAAVAAGTATAATAFGALAAGLAAIPVAGWIAAGAVAVTGIVAGIVGWIHKGKEEDKIREAYAEMIGKPLSEIDEEILDDVDRMSAELAAHEENLRLEREAKRLDAKISGSGADTRRLFAGDLSLLDEVYLKDGGLKQWKEQVLSDLEEFREYGEYAFEQIEKKVTETRTKINKAFGEKIKLSFEDGKGFSISGKLAEEWTNAIDILETGFGEDRVNLMNALTKQYMDSELSVEKLANAYIDLGEAANKSKAQLVLMARELMKTGDTQKQAVGGSLLASMGDTVNLTSQFKDFYMKLSTEQLNEIFKNGQATAASVYELKDSLIDIGAMSENTNVSFATLADAMNDLRSGILGLDDVTGDFIKTLDDLNKANHVIEDAMAEAAAFSDPESGEIIGEKSASAAEKLLNVWQNERFADPSVGKYIDFLFGEGEWENALKRNKYNAKAAMSEYMDYIATLSEDENYFDVWASKANESNGLWSVQDGAISFNLEGITDFDDLVNKISERTGWTVKAIEKMLADAQIWSNELNQSLTQLNLLSGLNKYISTLEVSNTDIGETVKLDLEQLDAIYKSGFDAFFDTFEDFVDMISGKLKGAGYEVTENNNKTYTADDIFSEFTETFGNKWTENEGKNFQSQIDAIQYNGKKPGDFSVRIENTEKDEGQYINGHYYKTRKEAQEAALDQRLNNEVMETLTKFGVKKDDPNYEYYISTLKPILKEKLEFSSGTIERNDAVSYYKYNYKDVLGAFKQKLVDTKNDLVVTNDERKSGFRSLFSDLFEQFYKETNDTTLATKKVQEYMNDEQIALGLGIDKQNGEEYTEDEKKRIEEIKNILLSDVSSWRTGQLSAEELNLSKQADLINDGTFTAAQYIINQLGKFGVFEKNSGFNETEFNNDLAASKDWWMKKTNANDDLNQAANANTQNTTGKKSTTSDVSVSATDIEGMNTDGGTITNPSSYTGLTDEEIEKRKKSLQASLEQIDFDWMHNFNELGEKATRNLEKLESEYELALKQRNKTQAELTENLAQQYINMEAEARISQAKSDHAMTRMENMLAKNAYLKEYTWYEDGMVKIDYDAINAVKADYNTTEKTKILFDELVSLAEVINENEQLQLETDLKQEEFLEEINNTIIDFENQVKDMVIEQYEEEINKLEQIDSAINDANSKLIDSIQKSLNRFRQDRENEKTESDIEDKQRRLALLRADTSGANKGEIMALEKEIGESQEDYTDTLIDQKISALQEQNEEASAQRQEQIDIANDQLNNAKENGAINAEVRDLLDKSDTFEGSPLETLWKQHLSKKGLSEDEWKQQLNTMQEQFVDYKSKQDFKDMYTSGGGINSNLANAIDTAISGDISDAAGTINSALSGYVIQSQEDIQNAIDGLLGIVSQNNKEEILDELIEFSKFDPNYGLRNNRGEVNIAVNAVIGNASHYGITESQVRAYLRQLGLTEYATGGLNTQTGPAWLDGTPSKPELVLNAQDTQNFLMLKDILSDVMRGGSFTTNQKDGDLNLEIYLNVEQGISSDYDVEQLVTKVKQEIAKVGRERNIQILTKR